MFTYISLWCKIQIQKKMNKFYMYTGWVSNKCIHTHLTQISIKIQNIIISPESSLLSPLTTILIFFHHRLVLPILNIIQMEAKSMLLLDKAFLFSMFWDSPMLWYILAVCFYCTAVSHCIMLLIDGQLGCIQLLRIMNKSLYRYSCTSLSINMFSFLLSKYLKVERLGHRSGICLISLVKNYQTFPKVVVSLYVPTKNMWALVALHSCQHLMLSAF